MPSAVDASTLPPEAGPMAEMKQRSVLLVRALVVPRRSALRVAPPPPGSAARKRDPNSLLEDQSPPEAHRVVATMLVTSATLLRPPSARCDRISCEKPESGFVSRTPCT